ncbi:MAG: hypothetical protein QOG06_2421 [Gaiellaceae bacterium]|jgi:hypothetical protein|nr:hypothetical protein [Gaiellaceae bacterium]
MRRTLVLATIVAATWVAVAVADGGGPSPGESFGWTGVVGPKGAIRYVTVPAGHGTLLEAVTVRGGTVNRWRYLRGSFGIPLVAFDNSSGGLARNGKRLVLVSHQQGALTRIAVVDPATFRTKARVRLAGRWAFDALSPSGSLMYLIQYLGGPSAAGVQPYAVRALNVNTRRLYASPVVDRREPGEKMTGMPLTRVESSNGWAYTFYSRIGKAPFVHALDTVHRRAFCVDVPWKRSANALWRVRLRVSGGELLLQMGPKVVARVDRKTFRVTRG